MTPSTDTGTEYRGHYVVPDMIEHDTRDRVDFDAAEYVRFAIMKPVGEKMIVMNWALTQDAARAKIDERLAAKRHAGSAR